MTTRNHHTPNAARGTRNRAAGASFERLIEAACQYYRVRGLADIDKTPEPMRPISPPDKYGRFHACYTKRAQPDFKGTRKGGRSVVFEAKHTAQSQLKQDVVLPQQASSLDRHAALGADCFILVSFGFRQFFKIPWPVFRDMKQRYGRKYITPKDIQDYRVTIAGGVLRFLGTED